MSQATKGFALVSGASSGIGAIYADRLAKRGHDLILVARRVDRLRRLAEQIARETGRKIDVIAADLGNREASQRSRRCCEEPPDGRHVGHSCISVPDVSGKVFQESLSGALAGVGDDAGHHEIGS